MTVETDADRAQYATNATTGPWTVPYPFLANDELAMTWTDASGVDTLLVLDVDYTVAGAGDPDGGTITTAQAYPTGGRLVILRDVSIVQPVEYQDGDGFPAKTHERALDRLTMIAQQQREIVSRALVLPASATAPVALPDAATRANKVIAFDSAGQPTVMIPVTGSASDVLIQLGGANGPSNVGYQQSTAGAPKTDLQKKSRRRYGFEDYNTPLDGVTASDAQLQATINAAINENRMIEDSGAIYKLSAPLTITMSGSARGLTMKGASGPGVLAQRGSIIDCSALSGVDALTIAAGNAQAFVTIEGFTFIGSATVRAAIKVTNASYIRFKRCVFFGFAQSGYEAVMLSMTAGFTGIVDFEDCWAEGGYGMIGIDGNNSNFVTVRGGGALDQTGAAIRVGKPLTLQSNRAISIRDFNAEGNARDLIVYAAVLGLHWDGGYIENNNNAHTAPRIEFVNDGTNASSGGVIIRPHDIQKTLTVDGQALIVLNSVNKGTVKPGWISDGNTNARFTLYGLNCTGIEFDTPHAPPGVTPYPVAISRTGAGATKVFAGPGSSDDQVDVTTLRIQGSAESYPGASTTTQNGSLSSRTKGTYTLAFDLTLAVKNGASTGGLNVGGVPVVNIGADVKFPLVVTGVTGTTPYFGIIAKNTNFIQVVGGTDAAVDMSTVAAGARIKGSVTFQLNP